MRPPRYAAIAILVATGAGLGAVRQIRKARDPAARLSRVSLTEVFVVTSLLAAVFAILGAEHRQDLRAQARFERFQADASAILGTDGRLGRQSDGTLTIVICERTFDDDRFENLAALLRDAQSPSRVSSVIFGTGVSGGAPPLWPGVTDASVEVLLQWPDLEWLAIDGTAISPAGRQRLLKLNQLNEHSRKWLSE
ncbi:hypothetical protein Pla123a_06070 [Posidoniimonas polymericola]|uniref:Uncharacterized protein n=1 Tax=Posidoniimonas polymericola TaxID=2528002 RepID=A0A5C5ZFC5_9BACT|nr:hypothetical protein [Posidoniimonas polymericola]TWT85800.1 hypothetical protein Pla123a_06070 [Posidoniimonas polymericola]